MNQSQYTTLLEVLTVIPDPRKARGQRYAWALLHTLLNRQPDPLFLLLVADE
jgi:hypothetical protein